ncbi:MAG: response regulator [Candidatus Hydrogenedentes bacterium]|nr:response regulator [Candidatus Hydrogenedentota bacterium]
MEITNGCRPIDILLVEDNPGDARLTVEALKEAKVSNGLYIVEDGIQAMEFLHKEGEYVDAPTPDLILLDLNLPRMSGQEVLAEIKEDPVLHSIPVIVLTTSQAEKDVLEAYDLHANCYVVKPVNFEQFLESIKHIKEFWFSVVKLPSAVGVGT